VPTAPLLLLFKTSAVITVCLSTISWDRYKIGPIEITRILRKGAGLETISPVPWSLNASFKF
jgi:hypothetical protein